MEENTNMEQANQTANQGQEPGEEKKTFTQDEVNSFIQSRIGRMKDQAAKEARAEYEQKMADLRNREMKIMLKERLESLNIPKEFADIVSCTDEKDLDKKVQMLSALYERKAEDEEPRTGFYTVNPQTGKKEYMKRRGLRFGAVEQTMRFEVEDPIRKAMNIGRRKE